MTNITLDASNFYDDGYVEVAWSHSEATANWYQWRVYRSLSGENDWELLTTIVTQQANYVYNDYRAPANVALDYAVVEVTSTDGGQTLVEGSYVPFTITPLSDSYWLIHPDTPAMNVRLGHVTADTFRDEDEESVLNIIGRGRKVDRGEYWGVAGELGLKFRDNAAKTGRQQLKDFLALKQAATFVYLRNPFGDVFKVALGGAPSAERESGIGIREHTTVTVPYFEVA